MVKMNKGQMENDIWELENGKSVGMLCDLTARHLCLHRPNAFAKTAAQSISHFPFSISHF